jgi:uncharacterized protein
MINEILVILVVIAVVYFLFMKRPAVKSDSKKTEQKSEDLVACHTCGTYTSISESIIKGGEYYCSQECLEGK